METIPDVLKVMGKATAREVAARMKIETLEVLAMLREHEELGQVAQVNGCWQLATKLTASETTAHVTVAAKNMVPAQSAEAFLHSIPQLVGKPAETRVCPTPKTIAAEIRRTKTRLAHLESLRITVRTLARQQRLLGL